MRAVMAGGGRWHVISANGRVLAHWFVSRYAADAWIAGKGGG